MKLEKANVKEYYYKNVRTDIIYLVPKHVRKVLDIGCGAGATASRLKQMGVEEVVGVEVEEEAAEQAKQHIDQVFVGDVEKIELPYPPSYFDCIIYADILEHLRNPWILLSRHRALLKEEGVVVSSIPNVRFHEIVGNLLLGNWEYREMGILDSTHIRFFTQKEIKRLFRDAGYKIIQLLGSQFPKAEHWLSTWKRERLGEKLKEVVRLFSLNTVNKEFKEEDLKNFLIFQYLIKAKKDDSI